MRFVAIVKVDYKYCNIFVKLYINSFCRTFLPPVHTPSRRQICSIDKTLRAPQHTNGGAPRRLHARLVSPACTHILSVSLTLCQSTNREASSSQHSASLADTHIEGEREISSLSRHRHASARTTRSLLFAPCRLSPHRFSPLVIRARRGGPLRRRRRSCRRDCSLGARAPPSPTSSHWPCRAAASGTLRSSADCAGRSPA